MKKFLFATLLLLSSAFCAKAEVYIQKSGEVSSRLSLGRKYSKDDIILRYGVPDEYSAWYEEAYGAYTQWFAYPKMHIEVVGGEFCSFSTADPAIEIFASPVGTIKVGMNIYFLLRLTAEQAMVDKYDNKLYISLRIVNSDDSLMVEFDGSGKITFVRWFYPV